MANVYRVEDSEGFRHIVAANSEGEAMDSISRYLVAIEDEATVKGSYAQFLCQSDLVSGGQVLSGEDQETAVARRTQEAADAKAASGATAAKK